MTGWRNRASGRIVTALCATAVVAAVLSGCAQSAPELDAATASALQASVLSVTEASAAGDPVSALAALDAFETQLKQDTASGTIGAERSARIQASIDLVRADLTAAIPPPVPAPTEEETDRKDQKGEGNGNSDKEDKKGKEDKDD